MEVVVHHRSPRGIHLVAQEVTTAEVVLYQRLL